MSKIEVIEKELTLLKKELRNDPENPELLNELGVGFLLLGKAAESISYLNKAIEIEVKPKYLYNLANAYSDNNDPLYAIEIYLKVLEIKPDHIPSLNNLADCYERVGEEARALELFRYLVKMDSENSLSHFNLGNYLLRKNQHIGAVKCYENALERDSGFTEAYYNISWILLEAGAYKQAEIYADRGLQSDPDNDELKRIKKKILQQIS